MSQHRSTSRATAEGAIEEGDQEPASEVEKCEEIEKLEQAAANHVLEKSQL